MLATRDIVSRVVNISTPIQIHLMEERTPPSFSYMKGGKVAVIIHQGKLEKLRPRLTTECNSRRNSRGWISCPRSEKTNRENNYGPINCFRAWNIGRPSSFKLLGLILGKERKTTEGTGAVVKVSREMDSDEDTEAGLRVAV